MKTGRWAGFWLGVGAGAAWLGVFALRFTQVPSDWWRWRDDAVITLSHAQNLVEFGTVGVSPGGDRVEGFSSPLQFILASAAFEATDVGYQGFLDVQVGLCLALTGALIASTIANIAKSQGMTDRRSRSLAFIASAGVALVIMSSYTTAGWLVSGMENPLAMLLGAAIVYVVIVLNQSRLQAPILGFLIGLLGLVRVEFPALMLPLLVGAALVVMVERRPKRTRAALAWLVGVPIGMWVAVHVTRFAYFGYALPNTALVQAKVAGVRQVVVLLLLLALFAVYVEVLRRGPMHPRLLATFWMVVAVAGGIAFVAVSLTLGTWIVSAWAMLTLIALAVALGALKWLMVQLRADLWRPDIVFAGLVFIPLAQVMLSGPARMDAFRVASLAVPWMAMWTAATAVRLVAISRVVDSRGRGRSSNRRMVAAGVIAIAVVMGGIAAVNDKVRDMPWRVTPGEDTILAISDGFRSDHLGGEALPIVANPDLGKISFKKRAVMVDLGWLGDPMLARISATRPDLEETYLNDVAAPDVVESHGDWSCRYASWLDSPAFLARWHPSSPLWAQAEAYDDACPVGGRHTIWVRAADTDSEYALTRQIASSSDPVSVIRMATEQCSGTGTGVFRCQGVRRAVTRNSQLLRDRGLQEGSLSAMSASPTAELDSLLILRGREWAQKAFVEFERLAALNSP